MKKQFWPNSHWMKNFANHSESWRKDEKEFARIPASQPLKNQQFSWGIGRCGENRILSASSSLASCFLKDWSNATRILARVTFAGDIASRSQGQLPIAPPSRTGRQARVLNDGKV
jgi:hypothetical protein